MSEGQLAAVRNHFDDFARDARGVGLSDQQLCEWLLQLSGRWLQSHGVPGEYVLRWLALQLSKSANVLQPMAAAARAKNDFGGQR